MSDDVTWVTRTLAGAPSPAMPPDVAARIEAALAAEQSARELPHDSLADEISHEFEHSTRTGLYGANGPTHYDKVGIGIVEHEGEWVI